MLYKCCLISFPKQQANAAVSALALRSYATGADLKNVKIIKNPDLAALKRGTGGRSSFNGFVCTVFGATGFIGNSVTNQLGKIGTQLIIPYRGNYDDEEIKELKLKGDLGQVYFTPFYLRDEASIKKAVKYSNVVINLIGRHIETRNFSYDDVHVKGARLIAKAAREAGVERLIHFSACGADQPPEHFYMWKPIDFFPSKFRGEQAVLDEFPDATIVRPATTFGWMDKFLWNIFPQYRRSKLSIPVWAKGRQTIKQPVYVADVGKATAKIMLDHTTKGQIYQLLGPEKYYLEEIVKYGLALNHGDRYGMSYHDARFDPWWYTKIGFQYIQSFIWHIPRYNAHYQFFEIECTSDKADRRLPGLADLGVEPTRLEDIMPSIMTTQFLAAPTYLRAPEEFSPVDPPKPAYPKLYTP